MLNQARPGNNITAVGFLADMSMSSPSDARSRDWSNLMIARDLIFDAELRLPCSPVFAQSE